MFDSLSGPAGPFSVIWGIFTFYLLIILDIDYHIGSEQEKEVREASTSTFQWDVNLTPLM